MILIHNGKDANFLPLNKELPWQVRSVVGLLFFVAFVFYFGHKLVPEVLSYGFQKEGSTLHHGFTYSYVRLFSPTK